MKIKRFFSLLLAAVLIAAAPGRAAGAETASAARPGLRELSAFSAVNPVSRYALSALNHAVVESILAAGGEDPASGPEAARAQAAAILTQFAQACAARRSAGETTPYGEHGRLGVSGGRLVDSGQQPVQLRGVSTHGIAWYPQYVGEDTFRTLRDSWGCSVVRIAMYTEGDGGYCVSDDAQKQKLRDLVDRGVRAASELGLYVIVDWHILSDGDPNIHADDAAEFFSWAAERYAGYGNVLYEICNEPNSGADWAAVKRYARRIIPVIRSADENSVVIVGTPTWSQDVDHAAADPLEFDNVLYAVHFYAATHKDDLRAKVKAALDAGLPLFVSEFGICDASGNGSVDEDSADAWISLLNRYSVSWCCWNLSDKDESSALLLPAAGETAGWDADELSAEGKWLLTALGGSAGAGESGGSGSSGGETSSEGGSLSADGQLVNSWTDGAREFRQYKVTVRNNSAAAVSGWTAQLAFSGAPAITQSWCGVFTDAGGGTVTVTPESYNASLAPGAETEIGFIVSGAALVSVGIE